MKVSDAITLVTGIALTAWIGLEAFRLVESRAQCQVWEARHQATKRTWRYALFAQKHDLDPDEWIFFVTDAGKVSCDHRETGDSLAEWQEKQLKAQECEPEGDSQE